MSPSPTRDGDRAGEHPLQPAQTATDELTTLQRTVDLLRADNSVLRLLLTERDRRIGSMLTSTSWRITAPLRGFGHWLKRQTWLGQSSVSRGLKNTFEIDRSEYQVWLRIYSSVDAAMRQRFAAQIDTFESRPLISIIMPSYNVDLNVMRAAIESVRRQIYPHWELCISDDASTLAGMREMIESEAAEDARIRVTFRTTNGHISSNSNTALDLARGDYVALLDADDLIPEDALFWIAREIALHSDVDLIFTDEDKIDEAGRFDPFFKPAWNPALMLSQNAFCHFGVFRRSLVEEVGRFREGYEGAQDHDLVLRCADATSPDRIRHIPRVLYHWRVSSRSTASGLASKPYAATAGLSAIANTLRRRNLKGRAEAIPGGFYQVSYGVPEPPPLVSIIVPTTLRGDVTLRCLQSVLTKSRYRNFELLLVASEHDLAGQRAKFAELLADPRARTISYPSAAFNFSLVCNLGAAASRGSLLCFLNDDVEVASEDWLEQLVARVSLDGVGAAGPVLYYPTDYIQHAGVLLGVGGVADHAFRNVERGQVGYFARAALEQDYTCLTAACLLVRRDLFDALGGFDVTLPIAFNDIDFCIRMRRSGARVVWTPSAQMYHHESLSIGAPNSPDRVEQFERDFAVLRSRWSAVLDNDPGYNPNLSLDPAGQFKLATPPRTAFAESGGVPGAGEAISRTCVIS